MHHLQHVHRAELVRQGHPQRVEVLERPLGLHGEEVAVFGFEQLKHVVAREVRAIAQHPGLVVEDGVQHDVAEVGCAHLVNLRVRHREPDLRVVPVFVHRAHLVAEVPRGGLDARPLEFGEAGDGAVGIVAGEQGLLGAALGVGARWGRGRRGEHRGGAEREAGPIGPIVGDCAVKLAGAARGEAMRAARGRSDPRARDLHRRGHVLTRCTRRNGGRRGVCSRRVARGSVAGTPLRFCTF